MRAVGIIPATPKWEGEGEVYWLSVSGLTASCSMLKEAYMAREASLFNSAGGSVLKGYRLLQRGGANIPPMWIQRASESRCRLHKDVAQALRRKSKAGQSTLKEWEKRYNKECFYYGLRVLLELARKGKTRMTKAPRS